MAGALRQIGFDYVFDTSFSADLTIMEEATEFLHRFKGGELDKYPMFTSCCPGWVRFVKSQFPELVGQLSTAKSPQQMFGAVVKSYLAERLNVSPEKICSVSVMPCTAKKAECDLPTMRNEQGIKDVDYALTTREILRMIRSERISVHKVWETPFDRLLGDYSGAGVIFGATGGVMEAALRTAYYAVTGENPRPEAFGVVRSNESNAGQAWREAEFDLKGTPIRIAVASGLANARKLCEEIVAGRVKYDFVEIMACPGGCAGGGGQPIHCDDKERAASRGKTLYGLDHSMPLRFSHENLDVQALYRDDLGEPLSEKAEELLHTNHFAWKMPNEE
jgi:NADH-quinone oxidoreductase subunit G